MSWGENNFVGASPKLLPLVEEFLSVAEAKCPRWAWKDWACQEHHQLLLFQKGDSLEGCKRVWWALHVFSTSLRYQVMGKWCFLEDPVNADTGLVQLMKKKKTKPTKQLLPSVSIYIGSFLPFLLTCLGTRPQKALLAPGRCLQWLYGGCSSVLGPATFLQVASNGGQLSHTFPPGALHDWRMRKDWDMWKRGKCPREGKEEPQKGQRM